VREAAVKLVAEGFVLEEEIDHVVALAAARYDAFRGRTT
jgi:hypothetical protein